MSNMNVKWAWKKCEGMQNAPEIGQQNASQQPTTLMQPTCILAHHSAYLQVISSIGTSKENPSTMMTSLMPMPYVGVLWWNPPCIQTLVHQPLSHSHATAHKYIWHPTDPNVCAACPLCIFSIPWTLGNICAWQQAPTSHTKTTLHICVVCPLHVFSTPWTLRNICTWQQNLCSHFTHQSNPTHWKGMILDITVLHRSIYMQNWWACICKSWQNHLFLEQYSPCHHLTVPISWHHKS